MRCLTKTLTPSDSHAVVCNQGVECMDLCAARQQIMHLGNTRAINVPGFALRTITLKLLGVPKGISFVKEICPTSLTLSTSSL